MTPEETKEYMKKYYANNKDDMILKRGVKVDCIICGRTVAKSRLKAHMLTNLCSNTVQFNKQKSTKNI